MLVLGLGHELHDPGEGVVARQLGDPHIEPVLLVDRAGKDLVAGFPADGHAFAGHGALVDRAFPGDDRAVHRHAIAGTDDDDIVHGQLSNGHLLDAVTALEVRGAGHELAERADGVARAVEGIVLAGMAEREEEEQERALGPLVDGGGPGGGHEHQQVGVELAAEQLGDRLDGHTVAAGQVGDDIAGEGHRPGQPEKLLAEETSRQKQPGRADREQRPSLLQPMREERRRAPVIMVIVSRLGLIAGCFVRCFHGHQASPSCSSPSRWNIR